MKKTIVLLLALISISPFLLAQVNVYHLGTQQGPPTKNGSFYVLPQTVLQIDVVVRAEEKMKGPYSDYAAKYLGLENVINFDFSTYTILDVSITTLGEPDPKQVYFAELGLIDSKNINSLQLELNNAGFLVEANNLKTTKSVAEIKTKEIVVFEGISSGMNNSEFYVTKQISTKIDTIIRRVAVDTVQKEQYFYRNRIIDRSTEDMALEALNKIEKIRESRYNLLTGFQETAYEAETIKYMDGGLKMLENEYLDLFRGKSTTDYYHYTFYYTPEASTSTVSKTLFKFSTGTGLIENRSGSGENIQIELVPNGLAEPAGSFAKADSENGIAYRLPGYAVVKVKSESQNFIEKRIQINQFGVVRRLPPGKFSVQFHPETGGIKSVIME